MTGPRILYAVHVNGRLVTADALAVHGYGGETWATLPGGREREAVFEAALLAVDLAARLRVTFPEDRVQVELWFEDAASRHHVTRERAELRARLGLAG